MKRSNETPPTAIQVRDPASTALGRPIVLSEQERAAAQRFLSTAIPKNTLRAYRADWEHFESYCQEKGVPSLPASLETVCAYLLRYGDESQPDSLKVSTLIRRLAAICKAHDLKDVESPTRSKQVTHLMVQIRKVRHEKAEKKAAITLDVLRKMVAACTNSRDRALLLFGFSGAFRRSEFVALKIEDVIFRPEGAAVKLGVTKTDQEGKGEVIPIARNDVEPDLCPIRALVTVIDGRKKGFIFEGQKPDTHLNDKAVWRLVKSCAEKAGVEPKDFGAHSLRAGFVTEAFRQKADVGAIQAVTRHKSVDVLLGYRREADPFTGSAAAMVWGQPKKEET